MTTHLMPPQLIGDALVAACGETSQTRPRDYASSLPEQVDCPDCLATVRPPKPRYYSVDDIDCDCLSHESIEEAIWEYLDEGGEICDVDVHEYEPEDLPEGYIPALAASHAESILEDWHAEGYGDPEQWNEGLGRELREEMTEALTKVLGKRQVWCCRKVATHSLSAAEVLALQEEPG